MTVPNENSLSGPYNGNGVSLSFQYDFRIVEETHLRVVLTGVTGIETDLALGADYDVTGVGDPAGGTVVMSVVPAVGEKITILRDVPFLQETDLENQGAFHAQTIEDALDMAVMRDLSLRARIGNSIHAPDTEASDMELPSAAERANKYLIFDANGAPTYINSQIDARYYGSASADPTVRPDGSAMQAADLYFSTASFQFRVYTGTSWSNALPTANLTLVNYREVSTTAKTTFTVGGGYQISAAFVYLNGVLLDTSEYTAADGNTVVLASACAINDEFRCVSYNQFSVADTLARSNNLGDLPSKPAAISNLGITATTAELNRMSGVTAPVQGQMDAKLSKTSDDAIACGYTAAADNDGSFASGSYTPTPAGGNFKTISNVGAFAIVAPAASGDYTIVVQVTNGVGSGAITLSGFTRAVGDAFTTTVGHKFFVFITKCNGLTLAVVQALQ